jgi:methionine synthase I (cobalamin-dependent)
MSTGTTNSLPLTRKTLNRLFSGERCLCDGAMGTMLFDRGMAQECCEELNLSQPQSVSAIHAEYLQAGAAFIGECCGTTPEHTRAMKSAFAAVTG